MSKDKYNSKKSNKDFLADEISRIEISWDNHAKETDGYKKLSDWFTLKNNEFIN